MFCGRHTVVFANLPPYGVLVKCACVAEVTDAYPLLPLSFPVLALTAKLTLMSLCGVTVFYCIAHVL